MDNKTAFWLALFLFSVYIADVFFLEFDLMSFLGKKLAEVSNWIAFWRRIGT